MHMDDISTEAVTTRTAISQGFGLKRILAPLLGHPRATHFIKWSVYLALLVNFGFYVNDDWQAFQSALGGEAGLEETLESFATSIDVIAWLGLVVLFELETYILSDEAFKGWVPRALLLLRIGCYSSIGYAAYGYVAIELDNFKITPIYELTDLCTIADQGTAIQIDVINYEAVTGENCADISQGPPFFQIDQNLSIIDGPALAHVQKLGFVDVLNSFTWLIVVFFIEAEIRIQSADRFGSRTLTWVRRAKTLFYGVLWVNAAIWLVTGYPMYTYDATLWIVGFWAIELNLAEWEQDRMGELSSVPLT